jgi:hypothetical protein
MLVDQKKFRVGLWKVPNSYTFWQLGGGKL